MLEFLGDRNVCRSVKIDQHDPAVSYSHKCLSHWVNSPATNLFSDLKFINFLVK